MRPPCSVLVGGRADGSFAGDQCTVAGRVPLARLLTRQCEHGEADGVCGGARCDWAHGGARGWVDGAHRDLSMRWAAWAAKRARASRGGFARAPSDRPASALMLALARWPWHWRQRAHPPAALRGSQADTSRSTYWPCRRAHHPWPRCTVPRDAGPNSTRRGARAVEQPPASSPSRTRAPGGARAGEERCSPRDSDLANAQP